MLSYPYTFSLWWVKYMISYIPAILRWILLKKKIYEFYEKSSFIYFLHVFVNGFLFFTFVWIYFKASYLGDSC